MSENPSPESLIARFRHLDKRQKQEFLRLHKAELKGKEIGFSSREWKNLGIESLKKNGNTPTIIFGTTTSQNYQMDEGQAR